MTEKLKLPVGLSGAAFKVAQRLIEGAAAEGLDEKELEAIQQKLARTYGQQQATKAVVWAAAQHDSGLTPGGAGWIQSRNRKMGHDLEHFQKVLRGHHQPQTVLVDSNDNRKLDANDLMLVPNSAGRLVGQEVGDALRDRVKVSAAVVRAARSLAASPPNFPKNTTTHVYNDAIWMQPDPILEGRKVKPGVRPSDALMDIYKNSGQYTFDCATALVVIQYRAILDLIGPAAFDAAVPELQVGPWSFEEKLKSVFPWWQWAAGSPYEMLTPERRATLRPGDVTYINNFDVSQEGVVAGWSGENVVYLGDGLFYGHPGGVFTEEGIVKDLNRWRVQDATRPASLTQKQARLDTSVLGWGKAKPSGGWKK